VHTFAGLDTDELKKHATSPGLHIRVVGEFDGDKEIDGCLLGVLETLGLVLHCGSVILLGQFGGFIDVIDL